MSDNSYQEEEWQTEEDVLRDLARASGSKVIIEHNLEGYIVRGNNPPPIRREPVDTAMLREYGLADVAQVSDIFAKPEPPDLAGISAMLQMVKEADLEKERIRRLQASPEPEWMIRLGLGRTGTLAISKGSPFNPEVEEFVPKDAYTNTSSTDVNETCLETVRADDAQNVNDDLAAKLKNDITIAKEASCFETKKQRNLAVMTLLQMYSSDKNEEPFSSKHSPMKLIRPDYFESTSCPGPSAISSPGGKSGQSTSSTTTEVKSEPTLRHDSSPKSIDPTIKKSIEKVNYWLGDPDNPNASAVYVGPVTYKRKDRSQLQPQASGSGLQNVSESKSKVVEDSHASQYRPSALASELEKKYTERSKKKKKAQSLDMWKDLDIILKEKDEKIRRQKLEGDKDRGSSSTS